MRAAAAPMPRLPPVTTTTSFMTGPRPPSGTPRRSVATGPGMLDALSSRSRLLAECSALYSKLLRQDPVSILNPVAEDRAGVTGVDDVGNPEPLGSQEGRLQPLIFLLERRQTLGPLLGIKSVEFTSIGSLDAAFRWNRAPTRRWPGVVQIDPLKPGITLTGEPEQATNDDCAPGDLRLLDRRDHSSGTAHIPGALTLGADDGAGLVDEIDDWQMKGVAKIDEGLELYRSREIETAAVLEGIIGDDADRIPVQSCEASHDRGTEGRRNLEQRSFVAHQLENSARAIDLATLARNDREQFLLAPVAIVLRGPHRRQLKYAVGHV